MQLGWIDFSKTERNKVLNVLEQLSEPSTLDELGIAPVRDGFANLFFPGTSTIQTRAKYFFCVPYAFKELEHSGETNPNRMLIALNSAEKSCGERLLMIDPTASGIIGRRALNAGSWVKRAPSDIYWAGLRRLGIFVGGEISISEYIRRVCDNNNQKGALKSLGNRNDNAEENECDDNDAGSALYVRYWNIPTYTRGCLKDITLGLTSDEADFLKNQIIKTCNGTMFSYILKNGLWDITDLNSFDELGNNLVERFPEEMRDDFILAKAFSDFVYVLRVLFNIIVSDGKNAAANEEWQQLAPHMAEFAEIDIDRIFLRLSLPIKNGLYRFLHKARGLMRNRDTDALKVCITEREKGLKHNRAKTMHAGEFDVNIWFGGGRLDYRFGNAKVIIRDIIEGENAHAQSDR